MAQDKPERATIPASIDHTWKMLEQSLISAAEAMPDDKYQFVPTGEGFKGVRDFAFQIKHTACGNFAFFKQIEGMKPTENCFNGGPPELKTKKEIVWYLRDSFDYADQVIAGVNRQDEMDRVEGPYAGGTTKIGMVITAVWHASDHYGQIVEYLRMNGIVPPASQNGPAPKRVK